MATETKDQSLNRLKLRVACDDLRFPGMRKLKVQGKDLCYLPLDLFRMTELEVLDLSPERESCLRYRLLELPSDIAKLANLRVLMLDTNELEEIPREVCLLASLERLSLSNNCLQRLPEGFGALRKLESLHLSNNKFDAFPLSICELSLLRFLDLCDNHIMVMPEEISQLKNLEVLLMFCNSLTKLPNGICKLTTLHTLWIGSNGIKRLPKDFGKLNLLDWGHGHTVSTVMDGNPLTHPPLDVCKLGVTAIRTYFDDRNRRGGDKT